MKKEIRVINSKGLHARPATIFAEVAGQHDDAISVSYGEKTVNGKSMLTLLSLGVPRDGTVTIQVEGEQAESMLQSLADVLGRNYD